MSKLFKITTTWKMKKIATVDAESVFDVEAKIRKEFQDGVSEIDGDYINGAIVPDSLEFEIDPMTMRRILSLICWLEADNERKDELLRRAHYFLDNKRNGHTVKIHFHKHGDYEEWLEWLADYDKMEGEK